MLKIKDSVDLTILQKCFEFSKIGDYYYVFFEGYNEIIIDEPTRIIEIDGDIDCYNLDKYNDILFNLINFGIVEKVGANG